MNPESVLRALSLNPSTTHVTHVTDAWQWDSEASPPTVLLLRTAQQANATKTVLVLVPLAFRYLVFAPGALQLGRNARNVTVQRYTGARPTREFVCITLISSDGHEPLPFPLPRDSWPRLLSDLTPTVAQLTRDEFEHLAIEGLAEAAEWHIWHIACPGDVPLARLLFERYASAQARSLFASLILPFSHLVRPSVSRAKQTAFLSFDAESAGVRHVCSWQQLGGSDAPALLLWCDAVRYRAEGVALFWKSQLRAEDIPGRRVLLADFENSANDALRAHEALFAARLPPTARAWVARLLAGSGSTKFATLEQAMDFWVHAHTRIASDVVRWAVLRAPFPAEAPQLWDMTAGLPAEWDRCTKTLRTLSASDRNKNARIVALAEMLTRNTSRPPVMAAAIAAAKRAWQLEQDEQARLRMRARLDGFWAWPKSIEEREARMAAVAPHDPSALARLFLGKFNAHLPPCVDALIVRARRKHHMVHADRRTLARWLVDLFPAEKTRNAAHLEELAAFALGVTERTRRVAANMDAFVAALHDAREQQHQKKKTGLRTCYSIIALTQSMAASEPRYACRCPYAAAAVPREENSAKIDVTPCVTQCATALRAVDAEHPIAYEPMYHILWAHETSKCAALSSVLDW